MIENQTLFILQYNVNNFRAKVMISLFESENIQQYDVLIIQESWRNSFQEITNNRLDQCFDLYYETRKNTRVCFYINKRIALAFITITYHSKNLITLSLCLFEDRIIYIHNIYNSCKSSNERSIMSLLRDILSQNRKEKHIVVDDFNLHHLKWEEDSIIVDADAYELIVLIEEFKLKRILSQDIIIWRKEDSQSTIDLAFITSLLRESIIESCIAEKQDNHSDHYSIRFSFELRIVSVTQRHRRNYNKTNTATLQQTLKDEIAAITELTFAKEAHDNTSEELNRQVQRLTNAIRTAIDVFTSYVRSCFRSKTDFTVECKVVFRRAKRLKRRWQRSMNLNDWEKYKRVRNELDRTIKKTMRNQFRKDTEEKCESKEIMWKQCKYIRDRTSRQACISALYSHSSLLHSESNSAKKSDILLEFFFSSTFDVFLIDTENYFYESDYKTDQILLHEVTVAISTATSKTASDEDEIANLILKLVNHIIASHLLRIFNVSLDESYCSTHFRNSVTIALRKSSKKHYFIVAFYRSISLLNTISKIMKYILTKRISYLAKTYQLLSRTHMRVRKIVFTEHALHYMIERIYSAWNKELIIFTLLLDVTDAFLNVSALRLLHNLRLKRIDHRIVRWIESWLSDRTTILKTSEYETQRVKIFTNISQESSLSLILFLFYNALLLKKLKQRDVHACDFVDDIELLLEIDTTEESCIKIAEIHDEVCISWAKLHEVQFNSTKYQLCHFIEVKKKRDLTVTLKLSNEFEVKSSESVKYLRVLLDTKLNWKAQINANKTKTLKTIEALTSLTDFTWDVRLCRMRQMLHVVFISQLTHECSIWYTSHAKKKHVKEIAKTMTRVQYRAERVITEAYKVTSQTTLNIETHSISMHLRLDQLTSVTTLRIIISSAYQCIIVTRSKLRNRVISSLEKLIKRLERKIKTSIAELEIITSFAASSWWISSKVQLDCNKEAAEKAHKTLIETTNALLIYTDESDINDKIEVAAVSSNQIVKSYLRSSTSFTVYSEELYEMTLIMIMMLQSQESFSKQLIVCIDNQAIIRVIEKSEISSDQHLVKYIVYLINELRRKATEVELHWVSAHIDIESNEAADKAIKQVTRWVQKRDRHDRITELDIDRTAIKALAVRALRSVKKQCIAKKIYQQWKESWKVEEHERELFHIEFTSRKAILDLHDDLTKELSSLAIHLRTKKIDLRQFLHRRKISDYDSSRCECRIEDQTVEHVLLHCSEHRELRRNLWTKERNKASWNELRLKHILTNFFSLKKTVNFIKEIELIDQFRAHTDEEY